MCRASVPRQPFHCASPQRKSRSDKGRAVQAIELSACVDRKVSRITSVAILGGVSNVYAGGYNTAR